MNRKPTPPGAVLRMDVIPALNEKGVSISQFARDLHISRLMLYGLLEEKKSVTLNIAARFGNGPGIWLRMHQSHDLWVAENELADELKGMPVYDVV